MYKMRREVTYSSLTTEGILGDGSQERGVQSLLQRVGVTSGVPAANFDFRIGDLRGGAETPINLLKCPSTNRRLYAVYEVAKAVDGIQRRFKMVKIKGDGRCMFRALAKGLAYNMGSHVSGEEETKAADELRMAVHDALCRTKQRQKDFEEVDYSINNLEGGRNSYCKRLQRQDFWGGELELLVLSKMLRVPVYIYRTAEEAGFDSFGYIPIVKYGEKWAEASEELQARPPVRLLYGSGNHYDMLL